MTSVVIFPCSLHSSVDWHRLSVVRPGLVPGIHALLSFPAKKGVDGRDKPGHDVVSCALANRRFALYSFRRKA
jgi:hypothetical protein